MNDQRFKNACKGLSKSRGGMNVTELKDLALKKGLSNLKTRKDLIAALCKISSAPKKEGKRPILSYANPANFLSEENKYSIEKDAKTYKPTKFLDYEPCHIAYFGDEVFCYFSIDLFKVTVKTPSGLILSEKWYKGSNLDRKNDLPAHIEYYGSRSKTKCEKWYSNGFLHREGMPAIIKYRESGKVKSLSWHVNGYDRVTLNDPTYTSFYESGKLKCAAWYTKYHDLERKNDLPAVVHFYESGKVKKAGWYKEGNMHRKRGLPAEIEYDESGNIKFEKRYKDNKWLLIEYDDNGNKRERFI